MSSPETDAIRALAERWPWLLLILAAIYLARAALELAGSASKNLTGITKLISRDAREDARTDERVTDLKQHVELLQGMAKDAESAAASAKQTAAAAQETATTAQETARITREQLDIVASELRDWHAWARTWWPRTRAVLDRAGDTEIPDPYPLTSSHPQETP